MQETVYHRMDEMLKLGSFDAYHHCLRGPVGRLT